MSNIVVYGMGKTGQSLAKMLHSQHQLYLYDDNSALCKVQQSQIPFDAVDLMIVSPAVKPQSRLVRECLERGIEIVSELQYCFDNCKSKCVSVTGTNGKTTVTQMIDFALKKCGTQSWLLGNGGVPFAEHLPEVEPCDIVVLESSSFQLNFADRFAPDISVVTNLSQDHLDYHLTYHNYIEAKCKNFINQSPSQFAVFNKDDFECCAASFLAGGQKLFYSLSDTDSNCYIENQSVVLNLADKIERFKCNWLRSQLSHNQSNILAATLVCSLLGMSAGKVLDSLQNFEYGTHRMTTVASFNGTKFVDDSKSTNIHSTIAALKCVETDTALIVGGSDKGLSFDQLFCHLQNVSLLVLVGQTANRIAIAAKQHGSTNFAVCSNMQEAVTTAYKHLQVRGGGTVLLSPACASFDMFASYAERGEVFCNCVNQLRQQHAE